MHTIEPDAIRELFARHNIRCTKQREDIYSVLHSSMTHPTAEELCRDVRTIQPGLSLATVYNTLETFTKHGLCRRLGSVSTANGACRYDADMSHHVHIIDNEGAVQDLPEALANELMSKIPPEMLRRIEAEMGIRISRVNIDLVAHDPDSRDGAFE
jgi:Fe2+ or Zn2+ uptake regulation protein